MQQTDQVVYLISEILNTNYVSSFVGSFLAAILFWLLFQKRIKKLLDYKEVKRLSGNFLGELLYNHIIASDNIAKKNYYFETKKLNVMEYEVDGIAEFLKREPLELDDKFYKRLQVFYSAGLKKNNMLLRIHWFSPNLTVMDIAIAKKNYLGNSKYVLKEINEILNNKKLLSQLRVLGLTVDKPEPPDNI